MAMLVAVNADRFAETFWGGVEMTIRDPVEAMTILGVQA